jgi:hypothetical protein
MQRSWKGKNVDLALLATRICDFLEERDFEIVKGETPKGYQMLASDSPNFRLQGYVEVSIQGKPNDFDVKFKLCRSKQKIWVSPFLLGMFGGGYLHIQELKSNEAWIKLEKELWKSLENIMLQLSGSAETSN